MVTGGWHWGSVAIQRSVRWGVRCFAALALMFGCLPAGAATFPTGGFFPLAAGNSWTYRLNGFSTETLTVLPGTQSINGVPTFKLGQSDGVANFFTNDGSGIRWHGQSASEFVPGVGTLSFLGWFSNPVVLVGPHATVGQQISGSGTMNLAITGVGTVSVGFTSVSTVEAVETITVPVGTAQALRLRVVFNAAGIVQVPGVGQGVPVDLSETDVYWAVDGIGPIRLQSTFDGFTDDDQLISTNVGPDHDGDGIKDPFDTDDDGDFVLDGNDNCPLTSNPAQTDTDHDGQGDACDLDDDSDGLLDGADNCPLVFNPTQANTDGDSQGDACDPDDDNDGVSDTIDNCPLVSNPAQTNTDGDGQGNACDTDDDNDGVPDPIDAFPLDAAESVDTDHDGIGNNADPDDDNDGVDDGADAFPLNSDETVDTDSDGMGDNFEVRFGLDKNDPADAALDNDHDGSTNLEEFQQRRNPLVNEAATKLINQLLLLGGRDRVVDEAFGAATKGDAPCGWLSSKWQDAVTRGRMVEGHSPRVASTG